MIRSGRAIKNASAPALPMPGPWKALEERGFAFRRGNLHGMMGRSGSCKSTAILDYLVRTGLPSLYFSADTDVSDQMPREMAARSGHSVKDVTQAIDNGCEDLYEEYARTSSIEWCFESSPTVEEIFSEVQAYVEKYDAYPEIIVVDVLLNVEVGNDDNGGLRYVEKQLHRLARLTRAAVIVVHHTREVGDSRFPQAKSEIDNKVDKLLERILTVAIDGNAWRCAPVKNRNGWCNSDGSSYVQFEIDPSRAKLSEWTQYSPYRSAL